MKIELHILQNFAPANLNRDDTGAPKDCEFGGYRRARISSQCLKRSVRDAFRLDSNVANQSSRSRLFVGQVASRVAGKNEEQAKRKVASVFRAYKLKMGKTATDYESRDLLFLPEAVVGELARLVAEHWDEIPDDTGVDASKKKKLADTMFKQLAKGAKPDAKAKESKVEKTTREAQLRRRVDCFVDLFSRGETPVADVDFADSWDDLKENIDVLVGVFQIEPEIYDPEDDVPLEVATVEASDDAETDGPKEIGKELKAQIGDILRNASKAPEIALFGRMLADQPKWNIDAASQVAHAISTNRVSMDFDFFTAVDDFQQKGDTGAAMMGTTQFNSACFYRYSVLDVDKLISNLSGNREIARDAVAAYLKATIEAIPTGKQNSMAAHNLPSYVMAVVKDKEPSLALTNSFEKPVAPGHQGSLVDTSIERLVEYQQRMAKLTGSKANVAIVTDRDVARAADANFHDAQSYAGIIEWTMTHALAATE